MYSVIRPCKIAPFLATLFLSATFVVGANAQINQQISQPERSNVLVQVDSRQSVKNQQIKHKANKNTITLVTGGISDTQISFAQDFSDVLDEKDKPGSPGLRVLPMLGKGGVQNALDLLHLKGVDLAIVQADTLTHLRGDDPLFYRNVFDRINYISSLYYAEWHVVARKEIKSLKELRGKTVNISLPLSGTYITSRKILELLGVRAKYSTLSDKVALEQLKAGKIDAVALLGGSPLSVLDGIGKDDGLHFVPADFYTKSNREVPFVLLLRRLYVPANLKHEHYPNLIDEGQTVPTVANGVVLAAYNWAPNTGRYQKVVRFAKNFVEKFNQFKAPGRHRKWHEVNLGSTLYEWKRFGFAKQLLAQNESRLKSTPRKAASDDKLFKDFVQFINKKKQGGSNLSDKEQILLFREFREFMNKSGNN